ncbi:MAG: DUF554 domain-containing protein [Paludibacteraceae bacterium]|nr:DUF554 domain-containing protein [Paludibacteraceae bacterium]
MIGTIVNTIAVVAGSSLGMLMNKTISVRIQNVLFMTIGLVTIALGITMLQGVENFLLIIVSLVLGVLIGSWCNIEKNIERFGEFLKLKLTIKSSKFSEGIISAFLLFCIGSMTILGAIQEGIGEQPNLLYTKSILDFFSSIILASTFGIGILFSAVPLFIFQALLTLLAMQLEPFFSAEIITGLSAVGGVMLMGLGINMLDIKKIPVANMLPALVIVCVLIKILELIQ